jgi:transcription initiation factor TFIIIB Brf1 subunit/transcription initiation factor TFIIB
MNSDQSDYSYSPDDIYEDKAYIYNGSEACPIYTNHHSIPKSNDKTIRPDLEKLGLPYDIINTADQIYQNMAVGTKRGKRRKMLLFFCAFTAYNQENIPVDPIWLANVCGLERSGISKALSMCSPVHTSFDAPLRRYTPKSYIPMYFKKINDECLTFPDGAIEDVYAMTDEVMERQPDLNDEKPQTVAAAILVYYLWENGYSIDKDKYKSIFGRSDMTINKIKKVVSKARNE